MVKVVKMFQICNFLSEWSEGGVNQKVTKSDGGMERTRWVFTFEQPICERKLIVQTLYSQEFLFVCLFISLLFFGYTTYYSQWWPLVHSYITQIQSNSKPHKKIRIETFKRTGMKPLNLLAGYCSFAEKRRFPVYFCDNNTASFLFFPRWRSRKRREDFSCKRLSLLPMVEAKEFLDVSIL